MWVACCAARSRTQHGCPRGDGGNAATALAARSGDVMCSGEVSQEQALHSTPNVTTNPDGITDKCWGMPTQNKAFQKGTLWQCVLQLQEVKMIPNPDTLQTECKISLFAKADPQSCLSEAREKNRQEWVKEDGDAVRNHWLLRPPLKSLYYCKDQLAINS